MRSSLGSKFFSPKAASNGPGTKGSQSNLFSNDESYKANHYLNDELCEASRVKYKVIKQLHPGDHFGEISIMSNLTVTSTVICTEKTLCGSLSLEEFQAFMFNFPDTKLKIMNQIYGYMDDFFFMLHKCIRNVHFFKNFNTKCI